MTVPDKNTDAEAVALLQLVLKPLIEAVEVNDCDSLASLRLDHHVVFTMTGSWSRDADVTLGQLRAIRRASRAVLSASSQDGGDHDHIGDAAKMIDAAKPDKATVERAAKAAFLAHWPSDKWERFKPSDYVVDQYRAIALAVIERSLNRAPRTWNHPDDSMPRDGRPVWLLCDPECHKRPARICAWVKGYHRGWWDGWIEGVEIIGWAPIEHPPIPRTTAGGPTS